uniref:Uncharacterized protein n=1 Tax=Anguilla anguilla TaxID=7936 RepID=A0A0E9QE71_ANGAN
MKLGFKRIHSYLRLLLV